MNEPDLFEQLLASTSVNQVEELISIFETSQVSGVRWVPFGNLDNNRGPIEVSTDPGRSLVERITNAIDAVLEAEYEAHAGFPVCRSPKDAATAWLNVPSNGLSELTPVQRRAIAQRITISILQGEGRESRVIGIRDYGIGILPEQMPKTILSLNASNKVQKYFLAGVYGQGGSSTFAVSKFTLIASRYNNHPTIGFTLVYYMDLPPEEYKTGHYVYLTINGDVLMTELPIDAFPSGTLVKHFGYDFSSYPSPFGPGSAYGLLNNILFDPVIPVWLEDNVHKTAIRRVIKGSRNALNGAIDEGDEEARSKLSHNVKMFYVNIAEYGRIGIEYWVLERPTKDNKEPSRSYVNSQKPIILTLNGQNHAELSRVLIKKNSDLPYLTNRIICHIDCNYLTPSAKRALIASSREEARRGLVLDLIQQEIIRTLKSDDELIRLNTEAKEHSFRERDESAEQQMRKEVTRLLRIHGIESIEGTTGEISKAKTDSEPPTHPRRTKPELHPIELHEPPTYIRIVWEENEPITFYSQQRRYIRIETDAISNYHLPNDPAATRVKIFVIDGNLTYQGSTPLNGGRMRIILEPTVGAKIGSSGTLRIELTRKNLPTLADERNFLLVEPPPARPVSKQVTLPPFDIRPVAPEDQLWNDLAWPDDAHSIASSTEVEEGEIIIYYSTVFPHFANRYVTFERRDPAIAKSFEERYKIWLTVHSLILYQDQQVPRSDLGATEVEDVEIVGECERQERCRMATLSAIFADREVRFSPSMIDAE